MSQLFNRFMHIGQCGVLLLLFKTVENLGLPSFRQLFKSAYIQIAVVQIRFQLGHELHQESAVLADGVAAQW